MGLKTTISFLINHPLGSIDKIGTLSKFFKWQLVSRYAPSYSFIVPYVNDTKLVVKRGMTGATGNIYTGLHEFNDMGFLLHFLREGDLFTDIGANVGSYTVLAAGAIKAETISFEPVPATFRHLSDNVAINALHKLVTCYNIGLGNENGNIHFTSGKDTMNHVATEKDAGQTIEVPVRRLDVLEGKAPILMKIDVEGFETEVLKGAHNTLANTNLNAIIIELNGSGDRYGYDEEKIHQQLLGNGFNPYSYEPLSRTLSEVTSFGTHNTIYIRDVNLVRERTKSAEKFKVLGHEV